MGGTNYNINWYSTDPKVLSHPLYLAYSHQPIGTIDLAALKSDLAGAIYSRETAPIVAFLMSVLRVHVAVVG